jgi:hypothetical protein
LAASATAIGGIGHREVKASSAYSLNPQIAKPTDTRRAVIVYAQPDAAPTASGHDFGKPGMGAT